MMILFNFKIIFNWRPNEFLYATVVDDYAGMKCLALGNPYFLTLKLLLMGMNADPSPIYIISPDSFFNVRERPLNFYRRCPRSICRVRVVVDTNFARIFAKRKNFRKQF